jgi:hypothetical protein
MREERRGTKSPPIPKRQEVTMNLRHIRPGSLEWQDAQTEEAIKGGERLTPEEIEHLRKLSDDRRSASPKQDAQTAAQ